MKKTETKRTRVWCRMCKEVRGGKGKEGRKTVAKRKRGGEGSGASERAKSNLMHSMSVERRRKKRRKLRTRNESDVETSDGLREPEKKRRETDRKYGRAIRFDRKETKQEHSTALPSNVEKRNPKTRKEKRERKKRRKEVGRARRVGVDHCCCCCCCCCS